MKEKAIENIASVDLTISILMTSNTQGVLYYQQELVAKEKATKANLSARFTEKGKLQQLKPRKIFNR